MKYHSILKNLSILIIPTLLLMVCFFVAGGSDASANSGDLNNMKGYESVLIKEGDTLSSLARQYASPKSHFSVHEYQKAIVSLNNLSSEYIKAGNYLLLPNYK